VATSGELDCRRCGACCKNRPDNPEGFVWYIEVGEDDALLGRADLVRKLVMRDPAGVPHLRLAADGRCLALRGAIGASVACGIYHHRPSVCRTVQPGGELCRGYRAAHGVS